MPKKSTKGRVSDEYVGGVILEYLVLRRENNQSGVTPYHLTHKIPKLRKISQKQDRIDRILNLLEDSNKVKSSRYDNARYVEITDEGMKWYKSIVKGFFDVFSQMYEKE